MRETLPKTKMMPCHYCGVVFEAKRKGLLGYKDNCPECVKKKCWQNSWRNKKITDTV